MLDVERAAFVDLQGDAERPVANSFSKWLRTALINASPVASTRSGARPAAMRTFR